MTPDWIARGIAVAGAAVAVLSLTWSVIAWRLSGPHIRTHAFLYQRELVIRVFNAGRSADTIEQLVLGGRRSGMGGFDLTKLVTGPLRLEPGESKRWVIDPDRLPRERLAIARDGWESVWLLLGSMRQRRVEVLPMPQARQPDVGWHLAPRRVKVSRYTPLMVLPVIVGCSESAWKAPGKTLLSAAIIVVVLRAVGAVWRGSSARRVRVERWVTAIGVALAAACFASARAASESQVLSFAVEGYFALSIVLAVPGLVSRGLAAQREVATHLKTRLPRRGEPPRSRGAA